MRDHTSNIKYLARQKGTMMPSDTKLRILQVGCGGRARAHIAAMQACGAVELLALCDLDEERLNAAGQQFGIARRYRDMAEAIRAEQPDLVDIVTPPTIRAAIVEPAIAAGARALLIEKPLALTPSESRRLVELGRERLIAVNTQYQWMPHWQRFFWLLKERALGEVRLLRASTRCNILEQGPHIIDLALTAAARAGLPAPEWALAAPAMAWRALGKRRCPPIPALRLGWVTRDCTSTLAHPRLRCPVRA
jgi:hypothetical protein